MDHGSHITLNLLETEDVRGYAVCCGHKSSTFILVTAILLESDKFFIHST